MRRTKAVYFRKLFWSMSIHFVAIHSSAAKNRQKITTNSYFGSLRSFKVIDVNTTKKHVTIACYDKQHVCACLKAILR